MYRPSSLMVCMTNRQALRRVASVVLSHFLYFRPPFGGPGRTNKLMFPKKKKTLGSRAAAFTDHLTNVCRVSTNAPFASTRAFLYYAPFPFTRCANLSLQVSLVYQEFSSDSAAKGACPKQVYTVAANLESVTASFATDLDRSLDIDIPPLKF